MAIRRCVLALVFSLALIHVVTVEAMTTPPDEVPIIVEPNGLVSVKVRINGAGPFRLLLDTGSGMSSVSRKLVRTLQLASVATADVVTPSGNRERDVVRLDVMSVGSASKAGLLAAVHDDRDFVTLGSGIDGIVGQNFLSEQRYEIDYRRKRLTWGADADSESTAGATLPLKLEDGRWLVGLPQGEDGRVLWFVPDSGAAALVLYDSGSTPALETRHRRCCAGVTTVNGRKSARVVLVNELKVGSLVIKNRKAIVVDRPSARASVSDGLLPLSMFASVRFEPGRQALRVTF